MSVMSSSALPQTRVILQTITPSIYPRHDYLGFPDGLHPDDEGKRRRSETVSARADAEGRLALATAPQDCLIHLLER